MSNWTHVAGVIRIDDLRITNDLPDFDELIGRECMYESPFEVWDDAELHPQKFLPMGSEGSLEKSIWVNPDTSCLAAYTVSIFGDLRDHYDPDAVIRWFEDKIKEISETFWVRQAAITVKNEYYGTKNWVFSHKDT